MSKYILGGDPPQSRAEQILMGEDVIPQSRLEELLLEKNVNPQSRIEDLLNEDRDPGPAVLINKTIMENGTYNAASDNADGYKRVIVNVPNSYAASDEGKVVSNGSLVAQTDDTTIQNGVVDTTTIKQLTVNVPQGITPTGTKTITINANGTTTEDVAAYANAQIMVAVPTGGDTKDVNAVADGSWWPERAVIDTATVIRSYAFYYSYGLRSLHVGPQVTSMGPYGINSNPDLQVLVFRSKAGGAAAPFYNNGALTILDASCEGIGTIGLGNCRNLRTIILRHENAVCNLAHMNSLQNTVFVSGEVGGTIYVPQSLITSYKAATNWSIYDSYGTITWLPIEGSIYETQYADGTPIITE